MNSVSLHQSTCLQKRYFIKTWGCQMNVYDSERMTDLLDADNYQSTSDIASADLVILNTCHIRSKATEKIFSELGRIKNIKEQRMKKGQPTYIAVTGCVAQAEGEEILKRVPYVDLILGPQTYHLLPNLLHRAQQQGRSIVATQFLTDEKFDNLDHVAHAHTNHHTAFITIQEGCDKFCRFCVVPYTRGAEISRRPQAIIKEARERTQQGVKEITLLGQNVNAWHFQNQDHKEDLASLIEKLASIKDIERIRYTTSHPRDMTPSLIKAHGQIPQLMPFLHLPVQSGSDKILKAMNRGHTAKDYYEIIDALRKSRKDMAFSSDFIVGFPGETDQDFEDTLALVRKVGFAQSYSFKYSPRPGTPAAAMQGEIPIEVKDARLKLLQQELGRQQDIFNKGSVGKEMPILFTSQGRKKGQIVGRSPWLQPVHVFADETHIGQVKNVKITMYMGNSLAGILV